MARYLNVPITEIRPDLGYKVPIDWWNAEIERKNKKADEADSLLDEVESTNFNNLQIDQELADKTRADIKSKVDAIIPLYNTDPAAATQQLNNLKREISRRTSNPGEDIYTFSSRYNTVKERQDEMDKQTNKSAMSSWYNYERYLEDLAPAYQENGKWKSDLNVLPIANVEDVYKKVSDYINQLKSDPDIATADPKFDLVDMGDGTTRPMLTIGKVSEVTRKKIENGVKQFLSTDEAIQQSLNILTMYKKHGMASSYEGNTWKERYNAAEEDYINTNSALIDQQSEAIYKKLQGKNLKPADRTLLEEQLKSLSKRKQDLSNSFESDIKSNLIEEMATTAADLNAYRQVEKTYNVLSNLGDNTKLKNPAKNIGIVNLELRPDMTREDLGKLNNNLATQKEQLKEQELQVENFLHQQAINFGFNNSKQTMPFGGPDFYVPNDQAQAVVATMTYDLNRILTSTEYAANPEARKSAIEAYVTQMQQAIGAVDATGQRNLQGFKFDDTYTFEIFQDQFLDYTNKVNQLQTQNEQINQTQSKIDNVTKATINNTELKNSAVFGFNSELPKGSGIVQYIQEPNKEYRANFYKTYFNLDEGNWKDFLINNSGKTSIDLYKINQDLVEQGLAAPLNIAEGDYQQKAIKEKNTSAFRLKNNDENNALKGLAGRLGWVKDKSGEEIEKNPDLLKSMSEIVVPTFSEKNDLVDVFDTKWSKVFRDMRVLNFLRTPNGKSFADYAKEINSDFDPNNLDLNTLHIVPTMNHAGLNPTVYISVKATAGKTSPPPVEVVITDKYSTMQDDIYNFMFDAVQADNPTVQEQAIRAIGHYNFAPGIFTSGVDLIPAPKDPKVMGTPVTIGEFENNQLQVAKDYKGRFQIYKNGEPQIGNYSKSGVWENDVVNMPKDLQALYYQLGLLIYHANQP